MLVVGFKNKQKRLNEKSKKQPEVKNYSSRPQTQEDNKIKK